MGARTSGGSKNLFKNSIPSIRNSFSERNGLRTLPFTLNNMGEIARLVRRRMPTLPSIAIPDRDETFSDINAYGDISMVYSSRAIRVAIATYTDLKTFEHFEVGVCTSCYPFI